jgi:hypothetical protein
MNLDHTIDSVIYRAAGKWNSNAFSGDWVDTWSDESEIKITVKGDEVSAVAPQFGEAKGKMMGRESHNLDLRSNLERRRGR